MSGTLYRYAAFTTDPAGGNPAGVWIGGTLPRHEEMQRIAAEVGFSETAFLAPTSGTTREIRYFSPEAEVTFCGHATIASGVVIGDRDGDGTYRLHTSVGEVPVETHTENDVRFASLTSVAPSHQPATDELIDRALGTLRWSRSELDDQILPVRAYAGAWHLVLAAATRERLDNLDYDFGQLREVMLESGLTTLQLIWREGPDLFHSRNPFPVGGVVEDPATGAAAAALGGYLRDAGLLTSPRTIEVIQGTKMGRPSRLVVHIPVSGGIVVSGAAVRME